MNIEIGDLIKTSNPFYAGVVRRIINDKKKGLTYLISNPDVKEATSAIPAYQAELWVKDYQI